VPTEFLQECIDFYSHVTVVLTILGEDQGTIDLMFDDITVMTVGYDIVGGNNTSYIEFDLAELKGLILVLDALETTPGNPDLPDTMAGVIRLTATELGPDHGRVTLSIEEAIDIADDTDETSVNIAAAEKVLEFEADGVNNSASLQVGLNAINAIYPMEDGSGISHMADLTLSGVTLLAQLTDNGDKLEISNIGIGGDPLSIDVYDVGAGDTGPIDMTFNLDTFSVTLDGPSETLNFDQAVSMLLDFNDQFDVFSLTDFSSTLGMEITQDTQLTAIEDTDGAPFLQVGNNGRITVTGDGDFAPGFELLQGTCISVNTLEPAPCPL
jgi:hypothetical protein